MGIIYEDDKIVIIHQFRNKCTREHPGYQKIDAHYSFCEKNKLFKHFTVF